MNVIKQGIRKNDAIIPAHFSRPYVYDGICWKHLRRIECSFFSRMFPSPCVIDMMRHHCVKHIVMKDSFFAVDGMWMSGPRF